MNGPWAEVETSDMNRQWTEEEHVFLKHMVRELGLQRRGVL